MRQAAARRPERIARLVLVDPTDERTRTQRDPQADVSARRRSS
ncbi:hypothetical protein AB0H31_09925 [Amycolatopsis japonica]